MIDYSTKIFNKAQSIIPGGVNSPVRAFRGVGGTPIFIKSAKGPYITDVDGNSYIDYVGSWGPIILGHAHQEVIEALHKALESGISYGAPTEIEVHLAQEIIDIMPAIEKIRMVSSGTEATMSAIRVARGYTERTKIVKFIGCYHGHADSLLVKAGSGIATLGLPDSAGIPVEIAQHTIPVPFNDFQALSDVFEKWPKDIACVIIEPVVGNMGCVPPEPGYLEFIRKITTEYRSVLIFDEVMTGFRLALGGAQEVYNIKPDMVTIGKIIGGGLPAAGYGGKAEIMDCVAPVGNVYQAGTLSGNPLAMTAGLTTLKLLRKQGTYELFEKQSSNLAIGLEKSAQKAGVQITLNRVGSMFTVFFTQDKVTNWETASKSNTQMFSKFFHAMLNYGVYLPPSQFESAFVSLAHTDEAIESTIAAADKAFDDLGKSKI